MLKVLTIDNAGVKAEITARQFQCADVSVDVTGRHVEQEQWEAAHTDKGQGIHSSHAS